MGTNPITTYDLDRVMTAVGKFPCIYADKEKCDVEQAIRDRSDENLCLTCSAFWHLGQAMYQVMMYENYSGYWMDRDES